MSVRLQVAANRLDFLVRGERFTSYHYGQGIFSGFSEIFAPGNRPVTAVNSNQLLSVWLGHGVVNGTAFTPERKETLLMGRQRSIELDGRRGALSAGFRQKCEWLLPDHRVALADVRTCRISAGPGEARVLDWNIHLHVGAEPITLGPTDQGLLSVRVASPLIAPESGKVHNSVEDGSWKEIDGRVAVWCACVGVVGGLTVGMMVFDHPDNPDHPTPWSAREDGLLSPGGFGWKTMDLAPRAALAFRYRLIVHRGYVEARWPAERFAEFVASPI